MLLQNVFLFVILTIGFLAQKFSDSISDLKAGLQCCFGRDIKHWRYFHFKWKKN